MECNIYDSRLEKIGILNSFISMTWNEQYSDKGSFSLAVYKDADSLAWLQEGHFVGTRAFDTLMYIYSVEQKSNQIWAYGAESKVLLQRKIYNGTLKCKNVESTLKQAVLEKNPFPFVSVAENKGLSKSTNSQRSYNSLFDLSKVWCDAVSYGFKFKHDKIARKLVYDIYDGNVIEDMVFAEKYGNLYNFKSTLSEKNWANVAYVAGAGEGADRTIVLCGDTSTSDLDRSEIYIDARDLQKEEGQTTEEYEQILRNRGLETLEARKKVDEISFEVEASELGSLYHLGDLVPFVSPNNNKRSYIRINGFTTVFENNKTTTKLQIGNPILRSEIK